MTIKLLINKAKQEKSVEIGFSLIAVGFKYSFIELLVNYKESGILKVCYYESIGDTLKRELDKALEPGVAYYSGEMWMTEENLKHFMSVIQEKCGKDSLDIYFHCHQLELVKSFQEEISKIIRF